MFSNYQRSISWGIKIILWVQKFLDALLISINESYASRLSEIIKLRFEELKVKDIQTFAIYYSNLKNQRKSLLFQMYFMIK